MGNQNQHTNNTNAQHALSLSTAVMESPPSHLILMLQQQLLKQELQFVVSLMHLSETSSPHLKENPMAAKKFGRTKLGRTLCPAARITSARLTFQRVSTGTQCRKTLVVHLAACLSTMPCKVTVHKMNISIAPARTKWKELCLSRV